jgi:hypothetical protein
VQLRVKVWLAVSGGVADDPLVPSLPLQPPLATQVEALLAVHDSVDPLPLTTELGFAESWMIGAAVATETVTDCVDDPPVPVQVSPYSVEDEIAPVDCEPVKPNEPLHPPVATQVLASLTVQFNVALSPGPTVSGDAIRVMDGAEGVDDAEGTTVMSITWDPKPSGPEQVSV